jgi:[methyl-Co(III) methanol-specific corrinoid protein]:coenzyme M methyltransferase
MVDLNWCPLRTKSAPFSVGDVKILGNVSSKETLLFGTPEKVKAEAKKAIEAGVDLLEPGCGIAPPTPLANVKAFVEAAKEFGWKSSPT